MPELSASTDFELGHRTPPASRRSPAPASTVVSNQVLMFEILNMRTIIAVIFLALPPALFAERLPIKSYTVADGLPNNVINKIVRDSHGFVWFCTHRMTKLDRIIVSIREIAVMCISP
jgi:Two component regulator propeller